MRFPVKSGLALVIGLVLGFGLLPPLLDRGNLANDALTAARAGAALLVSSGSTSQAENAARQSIAGDPGISLEGVQVEPAGTAGTVQVTVGETVHTFMSGWPGVRNWLQGWFHLRSTQRDSVGT